MASTLVQFLPVSSLKRTLFTQYSQGSVASFATQFNTDWAGSLPGGAAVAITSKAGASTVAEVIPTPGIVLELNPTDWIGLVNGTWVTYPASAFGRQVADGATNSNTTLTSATAAFSSTLDPGAYIAGAGIPPGTTIQTVNSSTSVTLSQAATATATGVALTITRPTSLYTPVNI